MLCGYLREASFADLLDERYRNDRNMLSSFWLVDNAIIDRIGERECKPFRGCNARPFPDCSEDPFPLWRGWRVRNGGQWIAPSLAGVMGL